MIQFIVNRSISMVKRAGNKDLVEVRRTTGGEAESHGGEGDAAVAGADAGVGEARSQGPSIGDGPEVPGAEGTGQPSHEGRGWGHGCRGR
jgi:hypothetical protein